MGLLWIHTLKCIFGKLGYVLCGITPVLGGQAKEGSFIRPVRDFCNHLQRVFGKIQYSFEKTARNTFVQVSDV